MPRVLYIHTQALRAETPHARRTFEMLTLLRRAGLSVDVLTLPRGDAWPKGLADHVYRTLPVPFARSLPPYGTGLRRRWATFVTALAAARLLLHTRYDAVHCADRAVRVGTQLAWLFGVRLVFEWRTASGHDLTAWARARSKRALRAVREKLLDDAGAHGDVPRPRAVEFVRKHPRPCAREQEFSVHRVVELSAYHPLFVSPVVFCHNASCCRALAFCSAPRTDSVLLSRSATTQ